MINKKYDLYSEFKKERTSNANGFLESYLHTNFEEIEKDRKYPAIVVFPGGGYNFLSDREREIVALKFFDMGYNAFVVDYTVHPEKHLIPLTEASMAMIFIREHAKEFNLNGKIAVCGFSAGGHMAGSVANLCDREELKLEFGERQKLIRPDAQILSYAVITCDEKFIQPDSFINLCGEDREKQLEMSLEKRVTKNSPPAFIWHTYEDQCVFVENCLVMAMALRQNEVPFELHVFEEGAHGLSICDKIAEPKDIGRDVTKYNAKAWLKLCDKFLIKHGFKD